MNEKGIIVGVNTPKLTNDIEYELLELRSLCESCDIEIMDTLVQNLPNENKVTYVGTGKIDEIKMMIDSYDADCVVFNDELSPSQISNLEKQLEITIYDRTYIILEIFKRRAKTKEASLQVEIARLKYLLPRLSGMRSGLSRQRGTGGGGAHGKGAGETQLELDRRHVLDRITAAKTNLSEITLVRKTQRLRRQNNNMKIVSLVGYTNSGKSTTLNTIMNYSLGLKKEVFEKDMLFATLETSTRLIKLENNHEFLLTDTIGFVEKLPHHLIEAFKSTLEEIVESDLILHVVDSSNPKFERQITTTNKVLEDLGVKDIPILYLFNKIDKVEDYLYIPNQYSDALRISAKSDINIKELLETIEHILYKDVFVKLKLPFSKGDIVNQLKTNYRVLSLEYLDNGIYIEAYVSETFLSTVIQYQL